MVALSVKMKLLKIHQTIFANSYSLRFNEIQDKIQLFESQRGK